MFTTDQVQEKIKSTVSQGIDTYNTNNDKRVKIAFPNINVPENTRPRIEYNLLTREQKGGTLKGNERLEERGTILFLVVVDYGAGESLMNEICEQFRVIFQEGTSVNVTDSDDNIVGILQFPYTPSVGAGIYWDNVDFRAPVRVEYVCTTP